MRVFMHLNTQKLHIHARQIKTELTYTPNFFITPLLRFPPLHLEGRKKSKKEKELLLTAAT